MEEKELNVKEEEKEVDSLLDAMKEADELKNNENEVEENKEEVKEVVKEEVVEEVKEDTKPQDNYVELNKPDFEDCEAHVEDMRNTFYKTMSKSKNSSTIITIVLLLLLVLGFALSSILSAELKWISYVIFGVAILGIVVTLFINSADKKKTMAKLDVYVIDFIQTIDAYAFASNDAFSSVKACKSAKLELNDIVEAHFFDTINAINSRNVVLANLNGKTLKCGELACRVPYQARELKEGEVAPKRQPSESYGVFGKYITYPFSKNFGVIVQLEGVNFYKPTYLDGYEEIEVEGLKKDYKVYATSKGDVKKLFNDEILIDTLNSFNSDDVLENMFLSINENGTKICLNYNETLMEIPMQKRVVNKPYLHYKNDIEKVVKLISRLER